MSHKRLKSLPCESLVYIFFIFFHLVIDISICNQKLFCVLFVNVRTFLSVNIYGYQSLAIKVLPEVVM